MAAEIVAETPYERAKRIIPTLTEYQREVLGFAAMTPQMSPSPVLWALERKGLVAKGEQEMHFRDGLPPMRVTVWECPIGCGPHIAWCEWAAENSPEEEE